MPCLLDEKKLVEKRLLEVGHRWQADVVNAADEADRSGHVHNEGFAFVAL